MVETQTSGQAEVAGKLAGANMSAQAASGIYTETGAIDELKLRAIVLAYAKLKSGGYKFTQSALVDATRAKVRSLLALGTSVRVPDNVNAAIIAEAKRAVASFNEDLASRGFTAIGASKERVVIASVSGLKEVATRVTQTFQRSHTLREQVTLAGHEIMKLKREITFHADRKDGAGKPYGTQWDDDMIAKRGQRLADTLAKWTAQQLAAETAISNAVAKVG